MGVDRVYFGAAVCVSEEISFWIPSHLNRAPNEFTHFESKESVRFSRHLSFVFCFEKLKKKTTRNLNRKQWPLLNCVYSGAPRVLPTGVVGRLSCREATRGALHFDYIRLFPNTHTQQTQQHPFEKKK
jgi:hypothetical protein